MDVEGSFSDRKISKAFLSFVGPMLVSKGKLPTPAQAELVLQFASKVWNAVVYDTIRGNTQMVERLRKQLTAYPPVGKWFEKLVLYKQIGRAHV